MLVSGFSNINSNSSCSYFFNGNELSNYYQMGGCSISTTIPFSAVPFDGNESSIKPKINKKIEPLIVGERYIDF